MENGIGITLDQPVDRVLRVQVETESTVLLGDQSLTRLFEAEDECSAAVIRER